MPLSLIGFCQRHIGAESIDVGGRLDQVQGFFLNRVICPALVGDPRTIAVF